MSIGPGSADRARGEPLLVLALIVGGWLAMRVAFWQPPFGAPLPAVLAPASQPQRPAATAAHSPASTSPAPLAIPGPKEAPTSEPLPPAWLIEPSAQALSPPAPIAGPAQPAQQVIGHELLLAAAFTHMELPQELIAYFAAPRDMAPPAPASAAGRPPIGRTAAARTPAGGRWTGDAWLLVRNGSAGPLAPAEPSYGRSQAGAVLRYRLARASGHIPLAYLRVTRALAGSRESEAAAGLAARPLAGVPVSVAGEVRVSQGPAGREVRPAAFAVTELPPAKLPLRLRAEAYAQAGYVGGRFATVFVDGQARVESPGLQLAPEVNIRAGGGVWGGAQKHAARLDVGPTAVLSFRLGETQSRVAVDYRVRVAGRAEPRSGPALTISAGF